MKPSRLHERIEVIYEDVDIVVVEKSSGVLTYPVEGEARESVIQLIRKYWKSREASSTHLYLLHRLDKDTSGFLVFAKTSLARQSLREQFRRHTVFREYLAVTAGIPKRNRGEIRTFLGRGSHGKRSVSAKGKPAHTNFEVLQSNLRQNRSLICCRLLTGRTHQVRIHLSHLGAPVMGDHVYGARSASRLALHACALGFIHPRTGRPMVFRSSLPEPLRQLLY